jgi:hypothetical protein
MSRVQVVRDLYRAYETAGDEVVVTYEATGATVVSY